MNIYIYIEKDIYRHAHIRTYALMHLCTCAHIHIRTHPHTPTGMRIRIRILMCIRIPVYVEAQRQLSAQTRGPSLKGKGELKQPSPCRIAISADSSTRVCTCSNRFRDRSWCMPCTQDDFCNCSESANPWRVWKAAWAFAEACGQQASRAARILNLHTSVGRDYGQNQKVSTVGVSLPSEQV